MKNPAVLLCLTGAAWLAFGSRPADIPFEKHTIDLGASETAAIADMNGDGRLDIVSGENWYEAPRWTKHKFRELGFTNNYVDNLSDHVIDVDGDGRPDVAGCAWFSRQVAWWKNPGKTGQWAQQVMDSGHPAEFCFLVDLDNDGKARELLPQYGGSKSPLVWFELKGGGWVKHTASEKGYGHGIGAGDVDGDGRADILTPKGWLKAPADPRASGWEFLPEWDLTSTGFLHVLDVNGDGRNDVIGSMAHDYGVFWLERMADGKWTKRVIDESWSQPHALTLVDLNGDGRKDLLTGKRYMAHNGRDPGEREPLGVYWYEYRPAPGGKGVEWTRHVIDYSTRTGGGLQLPAVDMDGDGDIDFVAPGKSGLFYFENLTKKAAAKKK